jgi:hypothetical protein
MDLEAVLEQRGFRAKQVYKELQEFLELLVELEYKVFKEIQELMVKQGSKVRLEFRVFRGLLESKVRPVFKG